MSVQIVCPSFSRAGAVKTFGAFGDDLLLVVAERQLEEYRAAYPGGKFDPHPDSLTGLPMVRQWMWDKYGTIFMVDDDVRAMFDVSEGGRVEPARAKAIVERIADQAEAMGVFLFGTSDDANPMHYSPMSPFRMTGIVRGRCMGLREGAKFFYPQDPSLDDELTLSGLNAYFHRSVWVDQRYALPGDEYSVGGLASRRSQTTLGQWYEKLRAMFGDAVVKQDLGDSRLEVRW